MSICFFDNLNSLIPIPFARQGFTDHIIADHLKISSQFLHKKRAGSPALFLLFLFSITLFHLMFPYLHLARNLRYQS